MCLQKVCEWWWHFIVQKFTCLPLDLICIIGKRQSWDTVLFHYRTKQIVFKSQRLCHSHCSIVHDSFKLLYKQEWRLYSYLYFIDFPCYHDFGLYSKYPVLYFIEKWLSSHLELEILYIYDRAIHTNIVLADNHQMWFKTARSYKLTYYFHDSYTIYVWSVHLIQTIILEKI